MLLPPAQVSEFVSSLEPEKVQALKVWRRPAHYKLFWSTALSLFISNSRLFLMLYCRNEPCLRHDLLLNFQQYVNIAVPIVSTSTEMEMPLVDMHHANASATRVSFCRWWVLMNPITQPCKPGMTFPLTSSAPGSIKALTLQSSLASNE